MTSSDLIVLLPWLAFGVALAVVLLLLRRESRQPPLGARQPAGDETRGPVSGPAGQRTGRGHPGAR
jgi:hypothetical protein